MSLSGGVVCGWGFVGMGSDMVRVVYPTVLSSSFRRRASNLVPESSGFFRQRVKTKPEDSGYEIAELPLLVSDSA